VDFGFLADFRGFLTRYEKGPDKVNGPRICPAGRICPAFCPAFIIAG
jgi:hypothetical protein